MVNIHEPGFYEVRFAPLTVMPIQFEDIVERELVEWIRVDSPSELTGTSLKDLELRPLNKEVRSP